MTVWDKCVTKLQSELSAQEFNTWIRPLQATLSEGRCVIYAPNRFVTQWVTGRYLSKIDQMMAHFSVDPMTVEILDASMAPSLSPAFASSPSVAERVNVYATEESGSVLKMRPEPRSSVSFEHHSGLNPKFTFDTFIEGSSNRLAKAAALQVAERPGSTFNPLFLYGGVGLGKTHLMHAIGNLIIQHHPHSKVVYLHSERFVADMVKALQNNAINAFKEYYRSVDALLIDDIQFFSGKDRSQEEFFHTFNALLEGHQQVIMTCDRYPKEISGVEERLKSRFGWGLTVAIEPPELETRVAILMNKSTDFGITLEHEVAFFIGKRIRSNVRELEGALRRVIASANFSGSEITIPFVKEALKDLISLQDKQITLDNIQKTVSEYYKIKVSELLSKKRSRSVARPRQIAMSLAKELTNHSLPEIGEAFGGRDHTTVLHACRTIASKRNDTHDIAQDYTNLLRILTT